jgi:transcriptional regulator with XRE-family HTH domain
MSDLIDKVRDDFQGEEYRHSYAEECLNSMIAAQIKVLREQRKLTQGMLAESTGMKQPRLSLLEDANYSNWSINTLKRIARAFDLALSVRFEAFSDLVMDFESMTKDSLQRTSFTNDPAFRSSKVRVLRRPRARNSGGSEAERDALQGKLVFGQVVDFPVNPNDRPVNPAVGEPIQAQGDKANANSCGAAS